MNSNFKTRLDSYLCETSEEADRLAGILSEIAVSEYNSTAKDSITGKWYATNRYDPKCTDKTPKYQGFGC